MHWRSFIFCMPLLATGLMFAQQTEKQLRVYRVPPDFMHTDTSAPSPDPFAAPSNNNAGRLSSREVLQSHGITFPEGARSFWESSKNTLTVLNSTPNHELTESLIEEMWKGSEKHCRLLLRVIEAPSHHFRDLAAQADVGAVVQELLDASAKPGKRVRIVETAFWENMSGKRIVQESNTARAFCTGIQWDAKRRVSWPYERRAIGFLAKLDPVIMADGQTVESRVDLALDTGNHEARPFAFTEPTSGNVAIFPAQERSMASWQTSTAIHDGTTRLLGMLPAPRTQKEGEEELSWAVFLTANLSLAGFAPTSAPLPFPNNANMLEVVRPVLPGLLGLADQPPRSALLEKLLRRHNKEAHEASLAPLPLFLKREGIPHEPNSVFEFKDDGLHLRNTPENIERIDALLEELSCKATKSQQFMVEVYEMDEGSCQKLAAKALSVNQHEELRQTVLQAVEQENAKLLDCHWLEGAEDAAFSNGRDHGFLDGLNIDPQGRPSLIIARSHVGSRLTLNVNQLDKKIGTTTCQLRMEHDSAPETLRRDSFRDPEADREFELPFTDFHRTLMTREFTLRNDTTRFLGLWRPAGRPDLTAQKRLHLAFLRYRPVSHIAPLSASNWQKPTPATTAPVLETRSFHVPPAFLSKAVPPKFRRLSQQSPADPFAIPEPEIKETAGEWFMGTSCFNIEGASASYSASNNTLLLRSTPDYLGLFGELLDAVMSTEIRTVALTLQIVDVPTPLAHRAMNDCLGLSDHQKQLSHLLASPGVQEAVSAQMETKSGDIASSRQTVSRVHLTNISLRADGTPVVETEKRETGLIFEATPVFDSESGTALIKLRLQHELSSPLEHTENVLDTRSGKNIRVPLTDFENAELHTTATMTNGSTRLLGAWRLKDKPETRRMAFLKSSARPPQPK